MACAHNLRGRECIVLCARWCPVVLQKWCIEMNLKTVMLGSLTSRSSRAELAAKKASLACYRYTAAKP